MRYVVLVLVGVFAGVCLQWGVAAAAPDEVYKNSSMPVERRVDDLLRRMTLEEKIDLLHGNEMETHANPRLGIPALKMTDGPIGVRSGRRATSFPAGIAWASTFDLSLLACVAQALAVETLAKGRDMLLGPCVCIARAPQGGRNFESYGEDPYLSAVLAANYVRALQRRGVIACTKHFAANDQETERTSIDVRVDERALHEIHLPAFLAAVNAGSWSVMAAYNKINGAHASENDLLLNRTLKHDWKFRGAVVSDWGATHSTVDAANHGLDLEMPFGDYFGHGKLLRAVREGEVTEAVIDDKVRRILRMMFAMGVFEREDADRPAASQVESLAHKRLALQVALEGTVLLRNRDNVLPLIPRTAKPLTIALIGPNAATAREGGGGSSKVVPVHAVSALEGFRNRCKGSPVIIRYALGVPMPGDLEAFPPQVFRPSADAPGGVHGLRAEYFTNPDLKGDPALVRTDPNINFNWQEDSPAPGISQEHFSVRWSGTVTTTEGGTRTLAVRADDGTRVYLDDKLIVDDWKVHAPENHEARVDLQAGRAYRLRVEYFQDVGGAMVRFGCLPRAEKSIAEAVALARRSDVAVVCVGWTEELESEGLDRVSLSMPGLQDRLVEAVAQVNPRTIVVLNSGGSVLMPWLDRAAAVIEAWYPGEQGGNALADLILGRVNPSGKLPVSFYRLARDASSYGHYPGQNGILRYAEGIFVGYRHLDRAGIAPLFPFGYGLSYTRFELSNLRVHVLRASARDPRCDVAVDVINRGRRAGAEVVQLYVQEKLPCVPRPLQELKGFARVELGPGRRRTVRLPLTRSSFAYWDIATHGWRVKPGAFALRVGTSSRDIRAQYTVVLR